MADQKASIDQICVNAIRTLSIDMIQKANSGHPGLPLGAAPMAYVLWQKYLKHNPKSPDWPDRDRFVLSPGHGSALIYSLLHLTGYDLTIDDLKDFRQWGSKTPGHPEQGHTPGVESTTGPLGQGTAYAVGMAIAERHLANRFNTADHTIVDHYTYAIVSDGDLMEGVSAEAASLAGHLKLGKLIYLYDSNQISLDGPTTLCFSTEDVAKRYEAYGWQVQYVDDGDSDLETIDAAIAAAKKDTARPSMIIVNTTIGYGSPKQGSASCHGSPLGDDGVADSKKTLGCDHEKSFHVPNEAMAYFSKAVETSQAAHADWQKRFDAYAAANADLAKEWKQALANELPDGWDADLPEWSVGDAVATRVASGKALNAIANRVPSLIGGDADLSASTKTLIAESGNFDGQTGEGRNIRFGVREHAMTSIANGMAYHGGMRPYVATFFVFSDYMKPALRMSALNKLPIICVWTHDSVAVGEDGPTHQPIEHLMALRIIPNVKVLRPSDPNETVEAWRFAMKSSDCPVALVLTRQKLPVIDRSKSGDVSGLNKGAYVLADPENGSPDAIVIATGSEVHLALEAKEALAKDGVAVRVVAMPCWEQFEEQDDAYKESVLPSSVKARVSVEAGVTLGWSRWVGDVGLAIGIDHFGASAPGGLNLEKFGFSTENVIKTVKNVLKK